MLARDERKSWGVLALFAHKDRSTKAKTRCGASSLDRRAADLIADSVLDFSAHLACDAPLAQIAKAPTSSSNTRLLEGQIAQPLVLLVPHAAVRYSSRAPDSPPH